MRIIHQAFGNITYSTHSRDLCAISSHYQQSFRTAVISKIHPGFTLICEVSLNYVCPSWHMGLIYNTAAIFSRFYLKSVKKKKKKPHLLISGLNRKGLVLPILPHMNIFIFSPEGKLLLISLLTVFL